MSPRQQNPPGAVTPRSADEVMELERLGAVWPTKFSFSHSFVRAVAHVGFRLTVTEQTFDDEGRGRIVYRAEVAGAPLTFVVFSTPIPEDEQEDRIIATKWDATAALFLGEPSEADLQLSFEQVPKVVWGRSAPMTVTWSRANRSARLFGHVVERLAEGRQPDPHRINQVGYLIRTAGFSGNGRNGMVDFGHLREIGHPLRGPYQVQMLAAYLWREFGADLACHLARVRNPRAADLAPGIRRFMGVGNASGIGLVPFVVRHPRIIDRWIRLREIALAEVRSMPLPADDPRCDRIVAGLDRAARYFRLEPAGELDEFLPGRAVAADLKLAEDMFARLRARNGDDTGPVHNAGNAFLEQARVGLTVEAQEFINVPIRLKQVAHPAVEDCRPAPCR